MCWNDNADFSDFNKTYLKTKLQISLSEAEKSFLLLLQSVTIIKYLSFYSYAKKKKAKGEKRYLYSEKET